MRPSSSSFVSAAGTPCCPQLALPARVGADGLCTLPGPQAGRPHWWQRDAGKLVWALKEERRSAREGDAAATGDSGAAVAAGQHCASALVQGCGAASPVAFAIGCLRGFSLIATTSPQMKSAREKKAGWVKVV